MFLAQTIIVYSLLVILMVFGASQMNNSPTNRKAWAMLPIITFTLIFGFRYGVGVDYFNYQTAFNDTTEHSLTDICKLEAPEYGYALILYILHLLQLPYTAFCVVTSFLEIVLLQRAFKDDKNNVLPYVYFAFVFSAVAIFNFTNVVRQEIAFCIFLYSIPFMRDNKFLKYFICCIAAIFMHKSAIMLIPLYFLWNHDKNWVKHPFIDCLILILCVFISQLNIINNLYELIDRLAVLTQYDQYENTELVSNAKMGFSRLSALIAYLFIIFNSKKLKDYFNSPLFNIYYDLFFIGVCLHFVFLGSLVFQRIILYFVNFGFIMLGMALAYFARNYKQSTINLLALIAIVGALTISFSSIIYNSEENTTAYVSVFQEDLKPAKDMQFELFFQKN